MFLLLFVVTFALVFLPGMWLVFREHDREMAEIEREIQGGTLPR